jgi:hypothetical protein
VNITITQAGLMISSGVFGLLAFCAGLLSQEKRAAGDSKNERRADLFGLAMVALCCTLAFIAGRSA